MEYTLTSVTVSPLTDVNEKVGKDAVPIEKRATRVLPTVSAFIIPLSTPEMVYLLPERVAV